MHTRDFLQENIFPFYIFHQYGTHPLLIYIQALVFSVFGYSVASLQGITVVASALVAPATYWASRWAFDHLGTVFARRAGLIAALGLALSTFFASYSYLGIEPASATSRGIGGRCIPVARFSARSISWTSFCPVFWSE